jgi:hypothetical protein
MGDALELGGQRAGDGRGGGTGKSDRGERGHHRGPDTEQGGGRGVPAAARPARAGGCADAPPELRQRGSLAREFIAGRRGTQADQDIHDRPQGCPAVRWRLRSP